MNKTAGFIVPGWDAPPTVKAVTSTRQGGFSDPPCDSFNLAMHVDDDRIAVRRNRKLLSERLRLPADPAWLNQTHGTKVAHLLRQRSSTPVDADGGVAFEAGIVCAVMTADCLPLFLCNHAGTRVAVIHVGWRGLADGIVEAAVAAMQEQHGQIMAWAGPSISAECFEIGQDARGRLGGPDDAYQSAGEAGKYYADLRRLTGHRLRSAGVTDYGCSDYCTYRDQDKFFSFRRDGRTGRMASLIWIETQFRL